MTSVLDLDSALYAVDSVGKSIDSKYQHTMDNASASTMERALTSGSRRWSVAMKFRISMQVRCTVFAIGFKGVKSPSKVDDISYPYWALGPLFPPSSPNNSSRERLGINMNDSLLYWSRLYKLELRCLPTEIFQLSVLTVWLSRNPISL